MIVHNLKCWPTHFRAIAGGMKRFELRRNDRDFKVDDVLVLQEYEPYPRDRATGHSLRCRVSYILAGAVGLMAGYVIMGIVDVKMTTAVETGEP